MAIKDGAVDIAMIPTAYYQGLVPSPDMLKLSLITLQEERERGVYDLVRKAHAEVGIFYVGRANTSPERKFVVCLTEKVGTPADLAGTTWQGGPTWSNLAKQFGASAVVLADEEVFTALERGLIQGYVNPLYVAYALGMHEATSYFIDHPFFIDNTASIMNLDTWNGLPAHLQELIMDVQVEMEEELAPIFTDIVLGARQDCIDYGVEPITFSDSDAKWYVDTIYKAEWDRQLGLAPVYGPKMQELLGW